MKGLPRNDTSQTRDFLVSEANEIMMIVDQLHIGELVAATAALPNYHAMFHPL
jgi:hypothetical protein